MGTSILVFCSSRFCRDSWFSLFFLFLFCFLSYLRCIQLVPTWDLLILFPKSLLFVADKKRGRARGWIWDVEPLSRPCPFLEDPDSLLRPCLVPGWWSFPQFYRALDFFSPFSFLSWFSWYMQLISQQWNNKKKKTDKKGTTLKIPMFCRYIYEVKYKDQSNWARINIQLASTSTME